MPRSIAEYYLDEINTWKDSINFNIEEIDELEELLNEVLRLNTITQLALQVEHHLSQLVINKQNMFTLKHQAELHQQHLTKANIPVANEMLTEEVKQTQKLLRNNLYKAEQQFLEIKYYCDDFIADALTEQKLRR